MVSVSVSVLTSRLLAVINPLLPIKTVFSFTIPFKPFPAISDTSEASKLGPSALYSKTALAMGCVDCFSMAITYFMSTFSSQSNAFISLILKTPLVRVPVLSMTIVFILVMASRKEAPLNNIPFFEAAPNPPK